MIRFRAWHHALKEMRNVGNILNVGDKKSMMLDCGWMASSRGKNGKEILVHWFHDETHLMQFTGILDKHKKGIFEGDIIRLGGVDNLFVEYFTCVWTLTWHQKIADGKDGMKIIHRDKMLHEYCANDLEVIGNIYEDKNLI